MKIKFYREKMKLSQRELANKINTTQATLQRYESGVNEPNIETLIKLADFFQISLDDLVERESDTINLNFYDGNKKALLKYLIQEDDKTIERTFDFYKGLKYEKLNQLNQLIFGNSKNETINFDNKTNNILNQKYENTILKSIEQSKLQKELENDPFFYNPPKDENK